MKNIKYLLGNVFIDPMLKQYYFKYTRLNKMYYQKMNFICFFLSYGLMLSENLKSYMWLKLCLGDSSVLEVSKVSCMTLGGSLAFLVFEIGIIAPIHRILAA